MPWSKVLSFTDPFPYQSAIRATDIELYPTTRGEFSAELTQINLHQLWMQRFHEKLPEVYASKIRPGRRVIGFLTAANQPTLQHCGMNLSPRDIVICSRDVMHQRSQGDCRFGAMSLATDDFDAACIAITGHEFSEPPLKHLVRPSPGLMSRLVKLHEMVGEIAKTTPDILALPEVARSLEQELIRLMIRCLTEGVSSGMSTGGRRHDTIVARFEEFLEANPPRRLRGAFGNGSDPLSLLAENAPRPPRTLARRSLDSNRYTIGHRPRLLGAGALLGRLPSIV
jgi:hypothetical protein